MGVFLSAAAGGSGLTYLTFQTILRDGNSYVYFAYPGGLDLLVRAQLGAATDYSPPNYPGAWTGEGFNYLLRSLFNVKVFATDAEAWLAAH